MTRIKFEFNTMCSNYTKIEFKIPKKKERKILEFNVNYIHFVVIQDYRPGNSLENYSGT